jgi:hypothetical protein
MSAELFPFVRLAPTGGDGRGVWCNANGVFIGPGIALVERRADQFGRSVLAPVSAQHLDCVLSKGYGEPFAIDSYLPGLSRVAAALNKGDLALANIALVQLRIPQLPSVAHGEIAGIADELLKARWNEHWPAGAPDGKGGQFSPKDTSPSSDGGIAGPGDNHPPADEVDPDAPTPEEDEKNAWKRAGKVARRIARTIAPGLAKVPRFGRILQALTVVVPRFIEEIPNIISAQDSPKPLEDLRLSPESREFPSFKNLKDEYRPDGARPGYNLHHIVEQNPDNRNQFTSEQLHNTDNVIEIPVYKHEEITAIYNSKPYGSDGPTVRDSVNQMSYEDQRTYGLEILRRVGVIQ